MTVPSSTDRWRSAMLYAWVSFGSILGGLARYFVSLVLDTGPGFPFATLFINATGSMIIGFYATLTGPDGRVLARLHHLLGLQPGNLPPVPWRHEIDCVRLCRDIRRLLAGVGLARPYDREPLQSLEKELTMQIPSQAVSLRIFIGESDSCEGKPLYEAIVLKARELHLAG